jgi:glucose/arabinose dehydrogenase
MKIPAILFSALSFATIAVAEDSRTATTVRLTPVCKGLREPIAITSSEEEPSRLFVGERYGAVRVCSQGKLQSDDALDIEEILSPSENPGLLSIALPPDFAKSKALYVSYTDKQGDTIVGRFPISASETATEDDLGVVIKFVQPSPHNHRSTIAFGPDKQLYIGLGDVPSHSGMASLAQNRRSIFGKLLRIDTSDPTAYKIPSDNPFAKSDKAAPEVWALGVQNPTQLSFDKSTQRLFFADAGRTIQEINIADKGKSFGWRIVEGSHCVKSPCSLTSHVPPIHEFSTSPEHKILGGVVYSGKKLPELQGSYIFAEAGASQLFRLHSVDGTWQRESIASTTSPVVAIGQGGDGEVYAATQSGELLTVAPH